MTPHPLTLLYDHSTPYPHCEHNTSPTPLFEIAGNVNKEHLQSVVSQSGRVESAQSWPPRSHCMNHHNSKYSIMYNYFCLDIIAEIAWFTPICIPSNKRQMSISMLCISNNFKPPPLYSRLQVRSIRFRWITINYNIRCSMWIIRWALNI
jgi:hypothetical protein